MNHMKRYKQQILTRSLACLLLPGIASITTFIVLRESFEYDLFISLGVTTIVYTATALACFFYISPLLTDPVEKIWQAVWHISPGKQSVPAPKLETIRTGRELISSLVLQIYNLVQNSPSTPQNIVSNSEKLTNDSSSQGLIDNIPAALFFVGSDRTIKNINTAASKFIGLDKSKAIDKSVYDILRMSFMDDNTLDKWIDSSSETKITDTKSWQRVKIKIDETNETKFFDLSASYSKDSSSGNDIILAIYDKTGDYKDANKSTDYVAVAVHELRTPLTLLRGYIEVFEDELGDQLTPEMKEFMHKMSASAQTLTAFVSNILNIARIDEDQLTLNLREADWAESLTSIAEDLKIRANVRGKSLELDIAPDLPKVAIDKISMYEVVNNLVDNAIKYSGQSPKIIIHSKVGKEGMIETSVQDFGVGIPASAMSGLFTRYYRSHRSKNAISGSGIGLYLVKAIITAHGGNVWVNSKENEGSSFGFSLQRFDSVKDPSNNDGIERQASGWIKNHSLYRR